MTKEQLDTIRARVEAATPGPWLTDSCLDVYTEQVREIDPDIGIELYKTVYSHHTAGPEGTQPWHDTHFMAHAREDVPALLAEVERLRAERDTHAAEAERQMHYGVAQHEAAQEAIRQRVALQEEVERLTADPLPAAAWVREVEQAAYRRGVAAMRREGTKTLLERNDALLRNVRGTMEACVSNVVALELMNAFRQLPDPEDK